MKTEYNKGKRYDVIQDRVIIENPIYAKTIVDGVTKADITQDKLYKDEHGLYYSDNCRLIGFDCIYFLDQNGKLKKKVELFDKQKKAWKTIQDNNGVKEIVYGGGAGGGKSYLIALLCLINCLMLPRSHYLIGRLNFSDIRDSTFRTLLTIIAETGYDDLSVNNQALSIKFGNGSIISCKHLSYDPKDHNYGRLGSLEVTGIFVDEAQEISKEVREILKLRARLDTKMISTSHGDKILYKVKPSIVYTCNPGKNFIYHDFYLPFVNNQLPKDKSFIRSIITDNPNMSDEIKDSYRKLDKARYEVFYLGNWEYSEDDDSIFSNDMIAQKGVFKTLKQIEEKEKGIEQLGIHIDKDIYISVDVAGEGADKTIITIWRGLNVIHIYKEDITNQRSLESRIIDLSKQFGCRMQNIIVDSIGIGTGLSDNLIGCIKFKSSSKSIDKVLKSRLKEQYNMKYDKDEYYRDDETRIGYFNDRSACYYKLSELVNSGEVSIVSTDYDSQIMKELGAIKRNYGNLKQIEIISKEKIKGLIGCSTDFGDSLSMRMYYEFNMVEAEDSMSFSEMNKFML